MYRAAGNLDITDYLNSNDTNLDEQAAYALKRDAENAEETLRMAGQIFAQPKLLAALAVGQQSQQPEREGNPFASLIPGLTGLAGNLFKGATPLEDDFSIDDAVTMGMPLDEAEHISEGGFLDTLIDGDIGETTFGSW